MVCQNGAVISCPGLFEGELIVMLEPSSKSILFVMNASDPDVEYCSSSFNVLTAKDFTQCILLI